jgi:hypothetical protein
MWRQSLFVRPAGLPLSAGRSDGSEVTMAVIHPAGLQIGPAHVAMLRQMANSEQAEQRAAEERAEAARNRAMVLGPVQHQQYELARAEVDRETALAEAARRREADERLARAQDYRDMLLASGQGRWRTVEEILTAARGWPAAYQVAYPAAEVSAAHRQKEARREAARSQAQDGETERLLARSRALSEALKRDPVLVRARLAAEAANVAEGAAVEPQAAYPAREITRVCDGQVRIW